MNALLAKNICNCHVESAIIRIDNDERDFETEILHEKTDKDTKNIQMNLNKLF